MIIYTHVMERPMGKRGTQILAPQIGIQNWGPPMLTFIPSRFIVRPSEVLPPMSPLEIVSRGWCSSQIEHRRRHWPGTFCGHRGTLRWVWQVNYCIVVLVRMSGSPQKWIFHEKKRGLKQQKIAKMEIPFLVVLCGNVVPQNVIPLLCGIETSRKGYLTSKNDGFAPNMFGVMWFKQKKIE